MLKKIAIVLVIVTSLFSVATLVPAAHVVAVDSKAEATKGLDQIGNDGRSIPELVKAVITILSYIVGIASVIMVIIGGMKYITSNGDSSNIASAKNTIIYAIVGLVIAIFAQGIVRFVMGNIK